MCWHRPLITHFALYLRCCIWDRERGRVCIRPFQVSSPNTRQTCVKFIRGGRAKLVLGDLNAPGIDEVVKEIKQSGGCVLSSDAFAPFNANVCDREAVGQRCDVANWDSQLALFELGISSFGAIDVVVGPSYSKTSAW